MRICYPFLSVIDDYSLVNFYPLDSSDNESIGFTLAMVDNMIQWGEDQDVKTKDDDERDDFQTQMADLALWENKSRDVKNVASVEQTIHVWEKAAGPVETGKITHYLYPLRRKPCQKNLQAETRSIRRVQPIHLEFQFEFLSSLSYAKGRQFVPIIIKQFNNLVK